MENRPSRPTAIGGDVDEIRLAVRVSGDDLDPDAITAALGIDPSFAARKGDTRGTPASPAVQRTGVWYVDLAESAEWVLEDAIITLLERLPSDRQVWEQLASRHHIDLVCGAFVYGWNRGFVVSSRVLAELARRRMALSVDIYCEDEKRGPV